MVDMSIFEVSYDDVAAALAPIGGVSALLIMLPVLGIGESILRRIEQGIEAGMPVDMSVSLPTLGVGWTVNLRGASGPAEAE